MRVFVYEYMTATSTGREPGSADHGMYLEGRAMRDALAEDLARTPGVEVLPFADEAAGVGETAFLRSLRVSASLSQQADLAIAIAPEIDDALADVITEGLYPGTRTLTPLAPAFRLCCNKLWLAEHWREHGVPTPATTDRAPTACEAFPVVWKPQYGAGSHNVFLLNSALDVPRAAAQCTSDGPPEYAGMILQEFVPGKAASCAFLCGPNGQVPLAPTFQHLSTDGQFKYEGGELPIPSELAGRAVRLAARAVACVPGLLGYVGVDLVLGDAEDGSRDFAIEINPRLTTSYIGLRALADFNIAETMLKVAADGAVGDLRWKPGRVRFGPDGSVERL